MLKVSPLAPVSLATMPHVKGVLIGTAASGERYQDRDDLAVVVCGANTTVAGVFTQSNTAGPAVLWSREVLATKAARAMVVNAGNANVCTGKQGAAAVAAMAAAVADKMELANAQQVFVSSTGVIGEPLNVAVLLAAIKNKIALGGQDWLAFAKAIATTDTYPKLASAQCMINGAAINFVGVAKGSGMIAPNMATMLAYIYTDAKIASASLQQALEAANSKSFNCMTVDSDTSTSDTCLIFATGEGEGELHSDSAELAELTATLSKLMIDLAQQIAKDGEGATKFITVNVTGASSDDSAKVVAKSIANSPLVKTAIAGEDANWGRIVMAIGKANEPIVLENTLISMGGIAIAAGDGAVADYQEAAVAAHLAGQNIVIDVDLGCEKPGSATVWTCDLTHGYIAINADYRS